MEHLVCGAKNGRRRKHKRHPVCPRKKTEKQRIFCGEWRNGRKWWEQVEVKRTLCMSGRRRLEILQLQEEEGLGESTRAALCYLKVCQHPHLQPITFQKIKNKKNPATYDFHPPVAGMPLQFFLPSSSSFHTSLSLNMATVPLAPPPPPYSTRLLLAVACECKKKGEKTAS